MKKIALLSLLFLLFPISIHAKEVILGGDSIGIQLEIEGILIIQTYQVIHDQGQYNPIESDIMSGDRILEVNNQKVETLADLTEMIAMYPNQKVTLLLNRNGELIERSLQVYRINHQIKTGLLVKDEALGIGTLTFIDPITHQFASLGHEVLDSSTKKILKINQGTLYTSQVLGIKKALIHQAGEKEAVINFKDSLGHITENTIFGVNGYLEKIIQAPLIETATQNEVELGEATMYTVLNDKAIEAISIEITQKYPQSERQIKSFEFIVTDKKCLDAANGIVQGMGVIDNKDNTKKPDFMRVFEVTLNKLTKKTVFT